MKGHWMESRNGMSQWERRGKETVAGTAVISLGGFVATGGMNPFGGLAVGADPVRGEHRRRCPPGPQPPFLILIFLPSEEKSALVCSLVLYWFDDLPSTVSLATDVMCVLDFSDRSRRQKDPRGGWEGQVIVGGSEEVR